MKKIKIGPSFILLVLFGVLTNKFLLILNYMLALSLHELAHLFVAVKSGYTLKIFKLDMFGLSIELNERIDDKDSFKINLAGPMFNLLIVVLCMSLYWLVPTSYFYLNTFCFANLILAIFNLLPVYPLDGGKIFRGMIKSDRVYKILDCVIRFSLAILSICAFFMNGLKLSGILYVLIALFLITNTNKTIPTMSLFKIKSNKSFDKVVILKVSETDNLFSLIKKIKSYNYTIFYLPTRQKYYDEDNVIELSLKYPLNLTLGEISLDKF